MAKPVPSLTPEFWSGIGLLACVTQFTNGRPNERSRSFPIFMLHSQMISLEGTARNALPSDLRPHPPLLHTGHTMPQSGSWFFQGPSGTTQTDVWRWWQERRFRYNRDLFIVGVGTCVVMGAVDLTTTPPGESPFDSPLLSLIGAVIYAVFANLAYTAGPVIDSLGFRGSPGRNLLKAGYLFSVLLTALPGALSVAVWLKTSVTAHQQPFP